MTVDHISRPLEAEIGHDAVDSPQLAYHAAFVIAARTGTPDANFKPANCQEEALTGRAIDGAVDRVVDRLEVNGGRTDAPTGTTELPQACLSTDAMPEIQNVVMLARGPVVQLVGPIYPEDGNPGHPKRQEEVLVGHAVNRDRGARQHTFISTLQGLLSVDVATANEIVVRLLYADAFTRTPAVDARARADGPENVDAPASALAVTPNQAVRDIIIPLLIRPKMPRQPPRARINM